MRTIEHERTRVHPRQRNGSCGTWMATSAGTDSLRIPKMRPLAANPLKWLTNEAIRRTDVDRMSP